MRRSATSSRWSEREAPPRFPLVPGSRVDAQRPDEPLLLEPEELIRVTLHFEWHLVVQNLEGGVATKLRRARAEDRALCARGINLAFLAVDETDECLLIFLGHGLHVPRCLAYGLGRGAMEDDVIVLGVRPQVVEEARENLCTADSAKEGMISWIASFLDAFSSSPRTRWRVGRGPPRPPSLALHLYRPPQEDPRSGRDRGASPFDGSDGGLAEPSGCSIGGGRRSIAARPAPGRQRGNLASYLLTPLGVLSVIVTNDRLEHGYLRLRPVWDPQVDEFVFVVFGKRRERLCRA